MEEKLASENIWIFWFLVFFFLRMKQEQKKNMCTRMITKNTSDLIEPRVYELGTIQTEIRYFRTSNRISLGSLGVSRTLVKGNEDS